MKIITRIFKVTGKFKKELIHCYEYIYDIWQ